MYNLIIMNQHYTEHFKKADPQMAKLVDKYVRSDDYELPVKTPPKEYVVALYRSIVSQQLSTHAARAIYQRFEELVGDLHKPTNVLAYSIEDYRTIGLSRQKASYIRSIAELTSDGTVEIGHLNSLGDQEVIDELVLIKGVGVWTAEMFLLFTLARPNVFSVGDLGLQNAAKRLYNQPDMSKKALEALSKRWEPYKTIASLALWYSLDNTPKT